VIAVFGDSLFKVNSGHLDVYQVDSVGEWCKAVVIRAAGSRPTPFYLLFLPIALNHKTFCGILRTTDHKKVRPVSLCDSYIL